MKYIILTILLTLVGLGTHASAQSRGEKVLVFDIKEEIGSTAWIHTSEALRQARSSRVDHVVLHMNTYGGEVSFADSIRSAILASRIPVYAFVDVNAASAGALIATACDSIFMSPGSSIGAATVVSGTDGEKMPDKYQSYMRGIMRSTAEAHPWQGPDTTRLFLRDPRIAEAFVDEAVAIPGIIDSAHVLTLTALEAMKLNYCEGIMHSVDEVVTHVAPGAVVERYTPTAYDNIKGGLMSTWLRGILILFIIGGIYFEIQSPGIGVALFVAIGAAILYFAPLYMDGLAANWEILVFLLGIGLLAAEVFVIPGFGVAGVSGIICIVAGLVLSLMGNDGLSFDGVPSDIISASLWTVILSIVTSVGLCVFLGRKFFKAKKGSPLARLTLETTQQSAEGYVGVEKDALDALVGQSGTATTDLRPGGKVSVGGTLYDAISDGSYIERGSGVKVMSTSSGQVVVRKE
ncbi:MAG: NfeD family protein [Bacteroidales bacterium]|nr:NfeD family protein [Bacteroidales bacterium]